MCTGFHHPFLMLAIVKPNVKIVKIVFTQRDTLRLFALFKCPTHGSLCTRLCVSLPCRWRPGPDGVGRGLEEPAGQPDRQVRGRPDRCLAQGRRRPGGENTCNTCRRLSRTALFCVPLTGFRVLSSLPFRVPSLHRPCVSTAFTVPVLTAF